MKRYSIIFLVFVYVTIFSQVNRFYYELTYKPNKDSTKIEKILTILECTENKSLYQNYELAKYDSIIIAFQENNDKFNNFDWNNFYKNSPRNSVKIIKENGIVIQKEYIGEMQSYHYGEKINFNWKLQKESEKIENYLTQKATTEFGGRKWHAWFTTEIPINEGPYKFFGLPGLIVKIEDAEKEYSWILKGNYLCKQNCIIPFNSYNEKYMPSINISKEKMNLLKKNYKKDPLQGADVVNTDIKPSFFKEYKDNLLKKINYYNNPIEKD